MCRQLPYLTKSVLQLVAGEQLLLQLSDATLSTCREGKFIREMAALPLAEDIPIAFNSCRKGPRGLDWRDDKPAEIYWAECQVSRGRGLADRVCMLR